MSSRMHGSEEALATFACRRARTLEAPCVLVGGLGMGFTLRAALDLLPGDAIVIVAELVSAVVEWNRGPLGPLAEHPLKDKRVRVEIGDVSALLRSSHARFDVGMRAALARQGDGVGDVDPEARALGALHPAGLQGRVEAHRPAHARGRRAGLVWVRRRQTDAPRSGLDGSRPV